MAGNIFNLPDTGQVTLYNKEAKEIGPLDRESEFYGQDGCFTVNPLSFTKLGISGKEFGDSPDWDGGLRMVLDNNTGLVWEIKSPIPDDINFKDDKYSWQDAQTLYIQRLNDTEYGGFSDWRMPNKDELRSIVDYGRINPSIDTMFFPHCQIGLHWCANTYQMQEYFGWVIFFGFGSATAASKTSTQYVRAVRGGYNRKYGIANPSRFTDNGDGTISDSVTGLTWQKDENDRMSWYDALNACKTMDLGGFKDWRLPNIKELNTILNLEYDNEWWYYKDFFPANGLQPPLLHYYSSTSHEKFFVWVTNFCFGYDGYYANKNAPLLFRAVRNTVPVMKISRQFKFPDSGQIEFFNDEGKLPAPPEIGEAFFGQDGNYSINPMSFTKMRENEKELKDDADWESGLRMVKDNNTGLIWEIKSPNPNDINYNKDGYSWEEAGTEYIEKLNKNSYGGFCDWRLPNKEELRSIVDYSGDNQSTENTFFPDKLNEFYWSSDTYGANPNLSWGIYFGFGCGICYLKTSQYRVRAVRAGCNRAFGDSSRYSFCDNGDGTITDENTGLMWKKGESPDMKLIDALNYCEELTLGGHNDWRLPTIRELPTLLDLTFSDSCWYDKNYFPDVKTTPLGFYWSSSTFESTFGWGVNFQFGYDGYYAGKKQGCYPFRPVRSVKKTKN